MFGRIINCKIANDNGRSTEFIRKRKYPDKSRCYECGEIGDHLSYSCPKNLLGSREPPKPKRKKKSKRKENDCAKDGDVSDEDSSVEDEQDAFDDCEEDDSLSSAIKFQVRIKGHELHLFCECQTYIIYIW